MSKRHRETEDGPEGGFEGASDGADTGSAALTAEEIEAMQAQLAEKDREIAELKDKYLRTLAESENARKRIRQQADESVRIQREAVLRDMLPIVDNLERAVEAGKGGTDAGTIVAGVEMVLRSLLDFLRAHGVTPITAVGQPFDPNRHEAVEHVHSDEHPPNTVVDEAHRGYLMGERVLRPARVSVSKHPGGRNGGENTPSGVENE